MIFWTVLFLLISIIDLVKGNYLKDYIKKIGIMAIKIEDMKQNGYYDNIYTIQKQKSIERNLAIDGLILFLPSVIFTICEFIYFFNAISVDPIKYPSISMIVLAIIYMIFNFIHGKKYDLKSKIDRNKCCDELNKLKTYTSKKFLISLIKIVYFGYMLRVLALNL